MSIIFICGYTPDEEMIKEHNQCMKVVKEAQGKITRAYTSNVHPIMCWWFGYEGKISYGALSSMFDIDSDKLEQWFKAHTSMRNMLLTGWSMALGILEKIKLEFEVNFSGIQSQKFKIQLLENKIAGIEKAREKFLKDFGDSEDSGDMSGHLDLDALQ